MPICQELEARIAAAEGEYSAGRYTNEQAESVFRALKQELETAINSGQCTGATWNYLLAQVTSDVTWALSEQTIGSYRETTINYRLMGILVLVGVSVWALIDWANSK